MTSIKSSTPEQRETAKRDALASWRSEALIALQRQYGFTLPRNSHEWRAVVPTWGTHVAQPDRQLRCIATDGLLGIFHDREARLFTLHVQWFVWADSVSNPVTYYDKEEKREKRFVVTKCDGAPPPIGGASSKTKEKKERKPKLSLLDQALVFIEQKLKRE